MTIDGYDRHAWYYDQSHAAFNEDLTFYRSLFNGQTLKILECGSGTGRLILPLAQDGHRCWGIDQSVPMLTLARSKAAGLDPAVQQRLHFVQADMAAFKIPEIFDVALIPHNTLMHLEKDRWLAALRSIRTHLGPDGRLWIDLINPLVLLATNDQPQPEIESRWVDSRDEKEVTQASQYWLYEAEQRLELTWIFSKEGEKPAKISATYHIRLPHQLEIGLRQSGFKLLDLFGSYQKTPFSENSERLILKAARP